MTGKWYLTTCVDTGDRWFVRRQGALLELIRPCGTERLLLEGELVRDLCTPCERTSQGLAESIWRTWRLLHKPESPRRDVPEPTQTPRRDELIRSLDARAA